MLMLAASPSCKEMSRLHLEADVVSYNALLGACEKGGELSRALDLFEAISAANLQPDVWSFNSAISICQKSHSVSTVRVKVAFVLFEGWRQP